MENRQEQRKSPRVKTHIPIRFRTLRGNAGGEGVSSVSRNLSMGGIRFRTKEFISMACRMIVEMDIPMVTKPLKAISKVAWIRKSDSGDGYEVGNRFLEISKNDKELISEYVDSVSQYNDPEKEEETEVPTESATETKDTV